MSAFEEFDWILLHANRNDLDGVALESTLPRSSFSIVCMPRLGFLNSLRTCSRPRQCLKNSTRFMSSELQ